MEKQKIKFNDLGFWLKSLVVFGYIAMVTYIGVILIAFTLGLLGY